MNTVYSACLIVWSALVTIGVIGPSLVYSKQPALVDRARVVLGADPRFANVKVEDYGGILKGQALILSGSVATENDKFDAHSAMFLKLNPPPKAVFNHIWSEEFRDQQIRRSLSRPKPAPCKGVLIYDHPEAIPRCEPFGVHPGPAQWPTK